VIIAIVEPRNSPTRQSPAWTAFYRSLSAHELYFAGPENLSEEFDLVVSLDASFRGMQALRHWKTSRERILVLMEPPCSAPLAHRLLRTGGFGAAWTGSPDWVGRGKVFHFRWPQDLVGVPIRDLRDEHPYQAVMVASFKVGCSRNCQYALRRQVVEVSRERGLALAVAGPGWDSGIQWRVRKSAVSLARQAYVEMRSASLAELTSGIMVRPASYVGVVPEQDEAYSLAPVAVVIENSLDYISEKLFDAWTAGSVPVYVGPSLAKFGIPESLAIHVGPNADDIVDAVLSVGAERAEQIQSDARSWLRSSSSKLWDGRVVLGGLGKQIAQHVSQLEESK